MGLRGWEEAHLYDKTCKARDHFFCIFMAKMLGKVPSRLKQTLTFPVKFSLFFQQSSISPLSNFSPKTVRLGGLSFGHEKFKKS